MWETWVWSLGWEDTLEKGRATHSSILAWGIPWTEEPGRLQSMGSQRVGHDFHFHFPPLGPAQQIYTHSGSFLRIQIGCHQFTVLYPFYKIKIRKLQQCLWERNTSLTIYSDFLSWYAYADCWWWSWVWITLLDI